MRFIFVCFALLVQGLPSRGAPELKSAAPNETIAAAIADLDHRQFRIREAAVRKLMQAGKEAIGPLAKAAETGSPEASDRAWRILRDMFLNGNADVSNPAREAIERIANSESPARAEARAILRQRIAVYREQLQTAGARLHGDEETVHTINLDEVKELAAVLPLLKEFPEVDELSISNRLFDDACMKHLLPLKGLKRLNLFESNIGDDGLKLLTEFPKLESVPMGRTRVTDAGLVHLGKLTQIEYIGVRGNKVTDAGLVHLRKLKNLTGLTLEETQVTDAGLVHLQAIESLTTLRLHTTAITDAGMEHLKPLKNLVSVDVSKTRVTRLGAQSLMDAIPGLRVLLRDN